MLKQQTHIVWSECVSCRCSCHLSDVPAPAGEVPWSHCWEPKGRWLALGWRPGVSSRVSWATVSLLPSQHPPIIALTRLNRQDPLGALGLAIGLICHQGLPLEPFFLRQTKPKSIPSNDLCPSKMSAYNSVLKAQFHSARQIVNYGSWPGLHHYMCAQMFIL